MTYTKYLPFFTFYLKDDNNVMLITMTYKNYLYMICT